MELKQIVTEIRQLPKTKLYQKLYMYNTLFDECGLLDFNGIYDTEEDLNDEVDREIMDLKGFDVFYFLKNTNLEKDYFTWYNGTMMFIESEEVEEIINKNFTVENVKKALSNTYKPLEYLNSLYEVVLDDDF